MGKDYFKNSKNPLTKNIGGTKDTGWGNFNILCVLRDLRALVRVNITHSSLCASVRTLLK